MRRLALTASVWFGMAWAYVTIGYILAVEPSRI